MHFSLLAAAASLALGSVQPLRVGPPAPADDGRACPPLGRHATGDGGPIVRKLVDAPPASLHYAVDRRENDCSVPALVRGARQR